MRVLALLCLLVITVVTAAPTTSDNLDGQAIGCYIDTVNRDLPYLAARDNTVTPHTCVKMCLERGFKYAGVENGHECWCGQTFGKHGKVDNTKCSKRCNGDFRQFCGAWGFNFIYETVKPMNLMELEVGCYVDKVDRDLPTLAASDDLVTPQRCLKMCLQNKFKYAGVENGHECWCGQTYGKHGKVDDAKCNKPCNADSRQLCGGWGFNFIYRTSKQNLEELAIGCYIDKEDRDLPIMVARHSIVTPQGCLQMCTKINYKFAGLKNGNECWCGQTFGKHGRVKDDNCNKPCEGDSNQKCGASGFNFIYATAKMDLGGQAIGCFLDKSDRDLTTAIGRDSSMTPKSCQKKCAEKNFKFAGVQYGSECFCDNYFGKYGKVSSGTCNKACSGDPKQTCGAGWHNFVYATSNLLS